MSTDTDPARRTTLAGFSGVLPDMLRHDLPASVVVFLVALPLSIGVAVATGAPVSAGLLAAVVGGLVAGALGGSSSLQVSGPTASLTVVIAQSIQQFGWAATCFITVGAGVLQVVFGFTRLARGALAIAPVVVHGMLAGIGIVIALQQLHVLLGGQSLSSSWQSIVELPQQLASIRGGDALVGVVVIAILLGWRYLPKPVRSVPAPLAAVVVATLLAMMVPTSVERITLSGSLFEGIGLPRIPDGGWGAIGLTMFTVALIASVETLLSALAVDRLRPGRRTDLDRELVGQGVANMTSGALGGLPIAAVIVRSITNVKAGARTKASTMLTGLWVLLFSVALVGVVRQIPKAALAGLLIVIGIGLVKLAHIRLARRTGDLTVYVTTVLVVVFANLLLGMVAGLALALALLLWRVAKVSIAAQPIGPRWVVTIDGPLTFLALPRLTATLAKVPPGATVIVGIAVDFADHAASDNLHDWARYHESTGGTVTFVEVGAKRVTDFATEPPLAAATSRRK